ncbi:MAG: FecR domain-containing protein [Bdellovibrio sp.]
MNTFFITLIFGFATSLPALAQDANGVMMVVKGDIKVTSGKDGKTEPGKVGRKVFSGDSILAGVDSRAKIVMSDRNILNVSPESKITIEKYTNDAKTDSKNVEIKVEYGKVRAQIEQKYDGDKNKFNIKTPTAVAGVRGTDFITGFNRATRETSIVTFSGMVAVGTAGPNGQIQNAVFVRPGQTTNVGEGRAPEAPRAMPKDELNQMNQDSANASSPQAGEQAAAPAPAAQEPQQEEPKQDPVQQTAAPAAGSSAGNSDNAPAPGPNAAGPGPKKAPETRVPASISPSMGPIVMDSAALPQGQGPRIPKMPVTMPSVTVPTTNPFVNEVVRNGGKSKVTIEIRK